MKIAFFILALSTLLCAQANEPKGQAAKPAEAKIIKVALACSSACEGYRDSYNEDSDPRRVWGWGEVLPGYLSSNVKILNFAKSGRSTVSFRAQGYWTKLLESKPDYVIMALGANDSKKGPKYSEPNTSYKENLRRFYKEAEAIGAKTIFVTVNQSMSRGKDDMPHFNKDGKVMRKDRAPYAQAMIEVAKEFNAPCIDLFTAQAKAMELIGEAECAKFYCIKRGSNTWDPSHTNIMGAHLLANIIATEMTKINSPLAKEVNKKRLWQYKLVPVIRKRGK
ncbi:MAG: hypothetical protein J6Q80_05875 [Lentisphaeria bacterium]|nr:hypothetical protein [Lentisphaeria bacterium]